jgi:HD superfamily phosphohydrolase
MYKTVYLRKNSAIAQRMIQKMTAALLQNEPMEEETFWGLTDFELLGRFSASADPAVRELYWKFRSRHLPRTAVALVLEDFVRLGRRRGKAQWVLDVSDATMRKFVEAAWTPSALEALEHRIEEIAGLPERSILLVPPTSIQRFRPQDITIFRGDGTTTLLSELYPELFDALEAEGRAYTTFRVCTFAEHREQLAEPKVAEAVRDFLIAAAQEA